MRVGISGAGATGRRVARQLISENLSTRVVFLQPNRTGSRAAANELGSQATSGGAVPTTLDGLDVIVICSPRGTHAELAEQGIALGIPVISTADTIEDVEALLALDERAKAAGVALLVGAGFMPGLTCVMARYISRLFDEVHEVHVAKHGTGGPSCARTHHRALKNPAMDWRDSAWLRRPGGSGRELVWFPEPVSGADCYRAAVPDAILLQRIFPEALRLTGRMAATRQDRFTAWLPMLSPPHAEGDIGAVRIEMRGLQAERHRVEILGAADKPAVATGAVAATAASLAHEKRAGGPGARGLAELDDPGDFLSRLRERGLRVQEFQGLDPQA